MLSRFGWSAEDLAGELNFEPKDILGKECVLKVVAVTSGAYKGGTEVGEVFPAGYGESEGGRSW